ncbi:thermonuclease family protein [Pseudolysinimonas sp.]|uniref:thermonuclease family protein n=1 Tax=Pseudolysinimonas sp. TaxID=2680009 RepID=UPI003785211E
MSSPHTEADPGTPSRLTRWRRPIALLVLLLLIVGFGAFRIYVIGDGEGNLLTTPGADRDADIPAGALEMEVMSITDGDTLRLRGVEGGDATEDVRLVGIDTPEVYPVYECYGDEAEAELARLAPVGGTVYIADDEDPLDDYGRSLYYLWATDGTFINLALVEGGYAEAIRVAPNDAFYDQLRAAEESAADAGLGMWSC